MVYLLFLYLLHVSTFLCSMDVRTHSNASSASTDTILLSSEEKKLCEWTMQEMASQNDLLTKHVRLTYPKGTTEGMNKNRKYHKRDKAKDVAENRSIFEQNNYTYIANHLALLLNGTSKSEFYGSSREQTTRLQQVHDNLEKLLQINDTVFNNTEGITQEPPRKKQKRM